MYCMQNIFFLSNAYARNTGAKLPFFLVTHVTSSSEGTEQSATQLAAQQAGSAGPKVFLLCPFSLAAPSGLERSTHVFVVYPTLLLLLTNDRHSLFSEVVWGFTFAPADPANQ